MNNAISPNPAPNVDLLPQSPIQVMAHVLSLMGTDLADQREVMRVLIGARFTSTQIQLFLDEARDMAQTKNLENSARDERYLRRRQSH